MTNVEYIKSMMEFVKWLKQQEDVPEDIKIESKILTVGVPVPKWIADKFESYIDKYNLNH